MSQEPFKQSDLSFAVGPKFQTVWGIREAIVFTLEGVGVSAFLGFAAIGHIAGMICALGAVAAAVLLLLSHLGKPMLAWRAIMNIRRSWISRGTVMIGLFVFLGALYTGGLIFPDFALMPSMNTGLLMILTLAGVFILLYPGFAMAASAGIAFWTSSILPVLSLLQGLLSGGLLVIVLIGEQLNADLWAILSQMCILILVLTALTTVIYIAVMRRRGGAARLSAVYLISKDRILFWTIAVGFGFALPFLALVLPMNGPPSLALVFIALGRIVGDGAMRYAFLKTGAYESVV